MRLFINYRTIVFCIVLLLIGACFVPLSITQRINQNYGQNFNINDGQILFVPMLAKTAYLINYDGTVNHTWSSDYFPGEAVYMLDDGSIYYSIKLSLSAGGAGGGLQKISWDDSLIWEFRYFTDDYLSHHDIEILPNGNILMIAWEYKTRTEAIDAGRDPNKLQDNRLNPDHIIEVKPTGPTSGEIVWEWHTWDHLVQDYDPHKDNYGAVENHPELIDINYGTAKDDWLHTNSVDYNVEFDQILLSVHNFNEIWVIDHSTTTQEAAGHTGGNSGKGGDLLYRWGNPQAYRAGNSDEQKLFDQHDARWIYPGCPGEGNIIVFNNGGGRPGTDYTSIDEIVPPADEYGNYHLDQGASYGPEEQIWTYDADFYAWYVGGAQRLPNGNTLICKGPGGLFFEVTPEKETIWEYENPYPNPFQNNVFKTEYYPPKESPQPEVPDLSCKGSLYRSNIKAGETVYSSFQVQNIGGPNSLLNWRINISSIDWGTWTFNPEYGSNLTPADGVVKVLLSVVIPDVENSEYEAFITVENQDDPEDFESIPVSIKTPRKRTINTPFLNYLKHHPNIFPILQLLLKILGK